MICRGDTTEMKLIRISLNPERQIKQFSRTTVHIIIAIPTWILVILYYQSEKRELRLYCPKSLPKHFTADTIKS